MTTLLALSVIVLALAGILFVVGMRRRWRMVHALLFWLAKHQLNPRQMRTAGQPGAYAGIIRTVGRRSGRPYATPVGPIPVAGGFLVALPYGRRPSWLRNLLASGTAVIVHEGHSYQVAEPSFIPVDDVLDHFSGGDRRSFRLLRTDECLRLTVTPEPA
jgi:deazaflavin-dependent oxidoreductase (nitroreductase family)